MPYEGRVSRLHPSILVRRTIDYGFNLAGVNREITTRQGHHHHHRHSQDAGQRRQTVSQSGHLGQGDGILHRQVDAATGLAPQVPQVGVREHGRAYVSDEYLPGADVGFVGQNRECQERCVSVILVPPILERRWG